MSPAAPDFSPLSLHDALPICSSGPGTRGQWQDEFSANSPPPPMSSNNTIADDKLSQPIAPATPAAEPERAVGAGAIDRKSTRLNSSHLGISYAVFCLKKKKNT